MRIAIISIWFAEKMGYSENCLPKALATLGHDVHLVTSNAQVYCNIPEYKEVYEPFIGPPLVEVGRKDWDGYKLYRIPYGGGRMATKELLRTLREIKPDIVQVLDTRLPSTFVIALLSIVSRYKLFLLTSRHASVSAEPHGMAKMMSFVRTGLPGIVVGTLSKKCYAVSKDAADIVRRHERISDKKIEVRSLGVDTELFHALPKEERAALRAKYGFQDQLHGRTLCLYACAG